MSILATAEQNSALCFSNFPIHHRLVGNLSQMGFVSPTPIQSEVIPLVLEGKDVFGQASTGTGKTGAFLIPVIQRLAGDRDARALILAPTRELAHQIAAVAVKMSKDSAVRTLAVVGGESMFKQIQTLKRNPQLIIATPGRLMDHLSSGKVRFKTLTFLVLDEVDRMLDMGFAPQLEEICEFLPKERQTLFFSATMTPTVRGIMRQYTTAAVDVICKQPVAEPLKIEERDIVAYPREKHAVLGKLVKDTIGKMIIFASTQVRTEQVAELLESEGHDVTMMHGGLSQKIRRNALADFRSGRARIMVATDVASRGIDVNDIDYVVNFDPPQSEDDYTHRIGRTGRYGRSGCALNFVTPGRNPGERGNGSRGFGGGRKFRSERFAVRPGQGFRPRRNDAGHSEPRARDFQRPRFHSSETGGEFQRPRFRNSGGEGPARKPRFRDNGGDSPVGRGDSEGRQSHRRERPQLQERPNPRRRRRFDDHDFQG
jgi:superfamily II DNA/RNA helicase